MWRLPSLYSWFHSRSSSPSMFCQAIVNDIIAERIRKIEASKTWHFRSSPVKVACEHSTKLDAPGARTCAPPLPSAPPCWTPREPPRRPHRGALPRRPATGTWMAQQWQGNKAPEMVGHMTYERFLRGEFFCPLCVTMMCHLIFFFWEIPLSLYKQPRIFVENL